MFYADRTEAGRQLAEEVLRERARLTPADAGFVVLALPRGGVPVAAEVARALDAPLDLILAQKLELPGLPGRRVGVLVEGDPAELVREPGRLDAIRPSEAQLRAAQATAQAEIDRRRATYLAGRKRQSLEGRVVVLMDDGADTGDTARAALKILRRRGPKELIVALPVASMEALDSLTDDADHVICLATPDPFGSLARQYGAFGKVSDEEITLLLDKAGRPG